MKIFILFILFTNYVIASPIWFHNIEHKSYELIAYGADKNLSLARDLAKSELSKQIKIKISSSTNIKKSVNNGRYDKSVNSNINTSTDTTLQGIKILKESKNGNLWYVSVIYDNRTLLQKIKSQRHKFEKAKINNSYIYKTPLVIGIFQTIKFKTTINLIRKNNSWYLNVSDNLFLLNQNDFSKLFVNYKNSNLDFFANKKIFKHLDIIKFSAKTKNRGYISILYVEESGKVGLVIDNIKINKYMTYPLDNDDEELMAYNLTNKNINELYVCIYSKEELDLNSFEQINSSTLDDSNYNFDSLLNLFKTNKIVTKKLKIKNKID